MEPRRNRLAALLLLAAVPPVLEAAMLVAVGFPAALGLPPQTTAVWPYDSYHDLRWLLVFHNSLPTFLLGFLALTVVRGLLTAGLTRLAWPDGMDCPRFRVLLWRNLEVAVLAAVVVSPWAAVSVAFSAVALSWYLFASLIPMLLLSPFLQRAVATGGWWRGLPNAELFGWSIVSFLVLTAAGAFSTTGARWLAIPVAAVAGAANGLLWRRTVAAAVAPGAVRWPRTPVAPVAVALTLIAALVAEALIGLAAGRSREWRPPIVTEPLPGHVPYAVIVISGHNSSWDGRPPADTRVERFSYLGLDDHQRPRAFGPTATHRSLGSSTSLLATQVEAVHRRTGRPVALVGESEGALVIRTYLERWPMSPVQAAAMLSPLVRPGRAYYPPPGYPGWGMVAGWELRAIFAVANAPKAVKDDPDEPFVRSLIADAPFYRNRVLCPVAGVRMVAFLPTVSAAEAPPGEYSRIPVVQVPAFHGGLLRTRDVHDTLIDFLAGDGVDQARGEYELLQRLGAAWQPPPLPLAVNPIWAAGREADPSFTGRICEGR